MANKPNAVLIGPFTKKDETTTNIINAAMRIRNPIAQPFNLCAPSSGGGATETSSTF